MLYAGHYFVGVGVNCCTALQMPETVPLMTESTLLATNKKANI